MRTPHLERLLSRLEGVKPSGSGWSARCPAHEDRRASLSIGEGDNGRTLVHCHAGCDLAAILSKLGLSEQDLFPSRERLVPPRRIAKTYDYTNAAGELLFQVVRCEPKDFRQRRPDGEGGWIWNLDGSSRVLYRLPKVLGAVKAGRSVCIVEGEKDVESLEVLGPLVATTNPQGAGKWRLEFAEALRGCKLAVVLPDNDDPGRRHALDVARSLSGAGIPVKVLELPGLQPKGDVSDWIERGGTLDQLAALVKAQPEWNPPAESPATDGGSSDAVRHGLPFDAEKFIAGDGDVEDEPKKAKPKPKAGTAIELEDAEPADVTVDGAALLNESVNMVRRFIVLPDGAAEAVALWIIHTYLLDAFDVTPLLAIGSPVKRCGKTSLMRIMAGLVARPLCSSSISAAAVFRIVEEQSPTLLVDEMDGAKDNEDLRVVLNSGHTRDLAFIIRCVGEGTKMEPRRFSTWCPKVLAFIGRLPGTLEDRAIRISLRRKGAHERRERVRRRDLGAILVPLQRRVARWAEDNFERLSSSAPAIPEDLDDRAADNWEPLLAIADAAGGRWPALARSIAVGLSEDRSADETDDNPGLLLLSDLRDLIGDGRLDLDHDGLAADDVCEALKKLGDRPWKSWGRGKDGVLPVHLARLLRPFRIKSEQIRIGSTVARRYAAAPVQDAIARYLVAPATPATVPNPLHASADGSTSVAGVAGVAGQEGCSGSETEGELLV